MNIIHSLSLSQKQLKDIRCITALCHKIDGCTLSCPEDGDCFWLLYEDGKERELGLPAAFLAGYKMEDFCLECYAFTRPDCRGRGYFSALLDAAGAWSREVGEMDLCFVTDHRCRAALEILEHLEAEPWYDEYMMERSLNQDGEAGSGEPAARRGRQTAERCPDSGIHLVKHGPEWEMSAPYGTCRLTVHGDRAYLYGLEILPALRGRGMGTRFVYGIISLLEHRGFESLGLQVSGTNEAALGLYKKTGFCITQTLSYYLY